jgi:transcription termination factor Rho
MANTRSFGSPTRSSSYRPRRDTQSADNSYEQNDRNDRVDRAPQERQERDLPTEQVAGYLDIMGEGHGFLRPKFTPSDKDIYISASQIRRFNLREGDFVEGGARLPKENERYYGLLQVDKINNKDASEFVSEDGTRIKRVKFEDLTPIYPNKLMNLETGKFPLSQRVIDLIAPIGFGQRGLIVSPPKAGKTTMLKDIAAGISQNHPDVVLMAVLVGERPEEVTDLSRSIKGDVIASNFDEMADYQTRAAEVALARAKRLVEEGKDVVILLDSITRLGRSYNLVVPPSGRTLSGGFDPVALYPPKHFFGAARNCEEGGSLTIIGTALVDTGSRMDDLIYEEFKGTGNMELHLDRGLAQRRIHPAIDVNASSTRQDQLMFSEEDYKELSTIRRILTVLGDNERTEILLERLSKTKDNKEFVSSAKKVA